MSYQDELQRLVEAKASMRQSIINKGVDVPDDAKIEDYADYILQIDTGGGYDPSNPTLEGLYNALNAGDEGAFPVGTEIPDTYAGVSSPLIVGNYQDITAADGTTHRAVGLMRKFPELYGQPFSSGSSLYTSSSIFSVLNGTYLQSCSEALRSVIAEVRVPYYNGSSLGYATGKVHLFSGVEIGATYNSGEGQIWQIWKDRTGLSSANNAANPGRIIRGSDGVPKYVWLRSYGNATNIGYVVTDGSVSIGPPSGTQANSLAQFWVIKAS